MMRYPNWMDDRKATEDHSLNHAFSPGSPDELAFNADLTVIDGVRPQGEIAKRCSRPTWLCRTLPDRCARAASGHAAAALPMSVMKSRRFTAVAPMLPTER